MNINKNQNYKKLAAPKVAPKFFCCPIFALSVCLIGTNFDSLKKSGARNAATQCFRQRTFLRITPCPSATLSRENRHSPAHFAMALRQGFSRQDGSCATQLLPAGGNPLWTPSCSALRFSHEKTSGGALPTLPPVDTKKGQGVQQHPPPGGTVPRRYHRISETRSSFCPGKSSHLLPGPLVIYVSSRRQTEPR